MAIAKPVNLTARIEKHRHLLKPQVGNTNRYVENGDYIVMIVAGPNARKSYHYNETEELFYQLEGEINVRIQEDGRPVDMPLGPGDMYLHPAGVPHSSSRQEGLTSAAGRQQANPSAIRPRSHGSRRLRAA